MYRLIRAALVLIPLSLPGALSAASCSVPANQGAVAAQVMRLANAQRTAAGLPALTASSALARSALSHACDMQRTGKFGHTGSGGSTHVSRARAAGCQWKGTLAENIGHGYATPEQVVAGWMNSPEHRANLLNRKVRIGGAAWVPEPSGGGYWVMEFAGAC
jgi:uncharacterized protein YkwD